MVHRPIHRLSQAGRGVGTDTRRVSAVAKITAPMVAERNDKARDGGSPERDFGHSERRRASNNRDELG
jgi:hypothetical protein